MHMQEPRAPGRGSSLSEHPMPDGEAETSFAL